MDVVGGRAKIGLVYLGIATHFGIRLLDSKTANAAKLKQRRPTMAQECAASPEPSAPALPPAQRPVPHPRPGHRSPLWCRASTKSSGWTPARLLRT
jgi:hypothetical protein